MVSHMNGDLLVAQEELNLDIICHQVNCQGKMNSGIAKQIREKWPVVYKKYSELCESWRAWAHALYSEENPDNHVAQALLGKIQWKWLWALVFGVAVVACADFVVQYAAEAGAEVEVK